MRRQLPSADQKESSHIDSKIPLQQRPGKCQVTMSQFCANLTLPYFDPWVINFLISIFPLLPSYLEQPRVRHTPSEYLPQSSRTSAALSNICFQEQVRIELKTIISCLPYCSFHLGKWRMSSSACAVRVSSMISLSSKLSAPKFRGPKPDRKKER